MSNKRCVMAMKRCGVVCVLKTKGRCSRWTRPPWFKLLALAGGDDVGNIRIPVGNEEYERALSIERVSRPFRREYGA